MKPRARRRLLLLLLVLLACVHVIRNLSAWSAALLVDRLSAAFGRPCSIGSVEYRLRPFEVEIVDLRIAGAQPSAPPFLHIPMARVRVGLAPLRYRQIVLTRVLLENPVVRVNAWPDPPRGPGGDDIPRPRAGGRGRQWHIGRLVVRHGEFYLNHERVPLDLDLPGVRARLLGGVPRGLRGRVSFETGRLRVGSGPILPMGADFELLLDGPLLRAQDGHLRGEGTDVAFQGALHLRGRPAGQFFLDGPVDLGTLDRHVIRSGFGMKGRPHLEGLLTVDGSRLRLEGQLDGKDGEYDRVPVESFAGHLRWDSDGALIQDLELGTLSGLASIEVSLPSKGDVAVRGELRGVDVERLAAAIWDLGTPGLAGGASGSFDVRWPKKRGPRWVSGSLAIDIATKGDGRTPLGGRLDWHAEDGHQTIERGEFVTPHTRMRLTGNIEADQRTNLDLEVDSIDLGPADHLVAALRRAVGNSEAYPVEVEGEGSFRGRWRGTFEVPVYEGRFRGRSLRWQQVDWGDAEWVGWLDPERIQSRSLILRKRGAELWLDGMCETGYLGERDRVELQARLRAWPAEDLTRVMDWDLKLEGPLSGDASVRGRRSVPEGRSRLTMPTGLYYGVPFERGGVEIRWDGSLAEATKGEASLGGGRVRFRGTVVDDGIYDGELDLEDVDAGALLPAGIQGPRPAGQVSGHAVVRGTLLNPRLVARFRSPRLFLGSEGIGAVEAVFTGGGDGSVRADLSCRSARVDARLSGSVEAKPPYASALDMTVRSTSFDPFLREFVPAMPAALTLVGSGEVRLRGPLAQVKDLVADLQLDSLDVSLPDYPLRNEGAVRARLEGGRLRLAELHLSGEGTDLTSEGVLELAPGRSIQARLDGRADLRGLSLLTPRLRGQGAARLTVDVMGPLERPTARGRLEVDDGALRVRGFPHGLEDVRGRVGFTEAAAEIEELSGTLGGGDVSVAGQLAYTGGVLNALDLTLVGQGMVLRYPEGLRSRLDADLRLVGDGSQQWLTGVVDVRDALWTKRYELATELLTARQTDPKTEEPSSSLHYDIRVRAPGTLRLNNNLATLQARADVALQGTPAETGLVGRAEIEGGKLHFQGQNYQIRKGVLDFADPRRVDPYFDIEAETRLRSYRVTLRANGTLGRVVPTLSSDPPLSTVQILSLLAGADESQVSSLTQAQTGQAQLAATGAATLAAGRLSEQVGLERQAERFGLNRFSIDPTLLRGGSGSTTARARLTVGTRVGPNLSVLYSQEVGGNEDRVVSFEYTVSDRLSLLLTQSDRDGLAFDVRLTQNVR